MAVELGAQGPMNSVGRWDGVHQLLWGPGGVSVPPATRLSDDSSKGSGALLTAGGLA
jgi:hypothetical protein